MSSDLFFVKDDYFLPKPRFGISFSLQLKTNQDEVISTSQDRFINIFNKGSMCSKRRTLFCHLCKKKSTVTT